MNELSLSLSEEHATDKAADRAALSEVSISELEAVIGGASIDGYPGCGTRPVGPRIPLPHPDA